MLLSKRQIRFKANCPGTRNLVDQCKDFSIGDRDDGPDALEMAIRLANAMVSGRQPLDNLGERLDLSV